MLKIESDNKERAVIVGIIRAGQSRIEAEEHLDELELLAETAGAETIDRVVQERERFDPAYMIGKGKAMELAHIAKYLDADLIIFDDDLSPAQARNIEKLCNVKIVDRSGLILDIFAKHARTREARTQVELAQLQYLMPRLTGQWKHLERQVGGIGVRGPGETQLEVDRRLIRKRIALLQRELEKIEKQRIIRREHRQNEFKVALVGYTNVGKSTLLNALTDATVRVEDRLFATLDATIRSMELAAHRRILLIDTVGFIRKLPHDLIASFKSTLEEVREADLLIHVIDIAHSGYREHMNTVNAVLHDLELDEKPVLKVFNKIDALQDASLMSWLKQTEQPCVFVAAQKGLFLTDLKSKIVEMIEQSAHTFKLILPVSESSLIAKIYRSAEVIDIFYENNHAVVEFKTTPRNAEHIMGLAKNVSLRMA